MPARRYESGQTPHTNQSAPLSPPSRAGVFEDHKSLLGRRGPQTSRGNLTRTRNEIPDPDFNSGSDDEMDCFSQKSQADDNLVIEKKQTDKDRSDYDPEVIATKSRAMHKLRFKKIKARVEEKKPQKLSSSSSSSPEAKIGLKESRYKYDRENCSEDYTSRNNSAKPRPVSPNLDTTRLKPRPRPRPRPVAPLPTSIEVDDVSIPLKPTSATNQSTRTPSEIPLPSPITKITAGNSKRNLPLSSLILTSSSSSNTSIVSSSSRNPLPSSTTVSSKLAPRSQQSFPALSPLSSPKHKRFKVVAAKSVPVISSRSRKDGDAKEFPALSPLLINKFEPAPKLNKKDKGKRKADALTPFPMSTQDFGGISSSEDESTVAKHHTRKRRLQIVDEASAMVNNMDLYEEEDSLFMSPSVDPSTLCPYCDNPLPLSPTRFFLNLLKSTLSKSYSDPRSTNPLGCKAPLSTFVAVCQRHDFETKVLPEAEAKGWPKTINWEELSDRVSRMKSGLEEIIQDSGEADLHVWIGDEPDEGGDLMTTFAFKGPRIQCAFWREAMKSFLKNGTRAMTDVRGQFQNFEKSQPGYYGELGQIIIQQTLFNMFPPDSFDPKLIKPFSANDFIQRILVPEVALRLIMEDRGLKGLVGAETALPILRESTTYGVTMFPEDSGEGIGGGGGRKGGRAGAVGVGDRIVMERAMKRRKEIELEEVGALLENGKEDEVTDEGKKGKGRGMKHATGEAGDIPWSQESELEGRGQKSRRRPSKKVRKLSGTDDGDDTISIDSKTDGNDSEKSVRTDVPEAPSRPRRNMKYINYDEDSDDKSSRAQRPGRSLSRPGSSRTQNGPPAESEWTPHKSRGEIAGSKAKQLEISDMDLCSTDDDPGSSQETYKPRATKLLAKKLQRSQDKLRTQGKLRTHSSNVVVDPDPNTPLPKRHSAVVREDNEGDEEPTPRPIARKPSTKSTSQPKQQTVLSLARARAPKAWNTDR